jgi:hypothetical protein
MSPALNIHSQEWLVIEAYCKAQIAELHEENESDLDAIQTAMIRGQILFARKVLSLSEDEVPMELVTNNDYIE